jgi:hypothetical protein
MSSLRTQAGKQVALGKELGRGAEGIVYEIEGEPDIAAMFLNIFSRIPSQTCSCGFNSGE